MPSVTEKQILMSRPSQGVVRARMVPTFASEPISALEVELITASRIRPVDFAANTPEHNQSAITMTTMTALLKVRPKYSTRSEGTNTAADSIPNAAVIHGVFGLPWAVIGNPKCANTA